MLPCTVQNLGSTGHISLNQPKKRPSSPSPLLLKGLPCPSLSSPLTTPVQPRNSLYPIEMKYTKTKWKSIFSCKIGTTEFMSCFHSNTPGKHSVSFALWGKHTPAVLTFHKKFTLSTQFSKKSEFLLVTDTQIYKPAQSQKFSKPQPWGVTLQSRSKRNPSMEPLLWKSSLIRLQRMNSAGQNRFCWFI